MVARPEAGWLALVPVKALPRGKSRLAEVLDEDARGDLVLFLLRRVVGACQEAGLRSASSRPMPQVHGAARALGADVLDDGGRDLSASVAPRAGAPRRRARASSCSPPTCRTSPPATCAS